MPKSLYYLRTLSNILKFWDLVKFLDALDKKPLSRKEIIEMEFFNGDQQKFYRRINEIESFKIITRTGIRYKDTKYPGVQYKLTKRGKELMKKLNEIDDLLRHG